jgi:hypothetical protein
MADPSTDAEQGGVKLILTPIQLAAILQAQTITGWQAAENRFFGTIGVIGGAVEMVASVPLLLAPEPTLLTKVGGGALAYVGADTASTGLRQVWTGRQEKTFTATVVQNSLYSLGVDPETAAKIGNRTDLALNVAVMIAAPLAMAQMLRAARVATITDGVIEIQETSLVDLDAEKAFDARSHVELEHVGKDYNYLNDRLNLPKNAKMKAASTFTTKRAAEVEISNALRAEAKQIEAWAASAKPEARLFFSVRSSTVTGKTLIRGTTALQDAYGVRVGLVKVLDANKVYFILTAYPEL